MFVTVPVYTKRPPRGVRFGGHCLVTTIDGVVWTGQVEVAEFVMKFSKQRSCPTALTVSVPQKSKGTTNDPLNGTVWPGAKVIGPITGPLVSIKSTTVTLMSVISPELLTVPLNFSVSPGSSRLVVSQIRVTTIAGDVLTRQTEVVSSRTVWPVQTSPPVATAVCVIVQQFNIAWNWPANVADAPGASEAILSRIVPAVG